MGESLEKLNLANEVAKLSMRVKYLEEKVSDTCKKMAELEAKNTHDEPSTSKQISVSFFCFF